MREGLSKGWLDVKLGEITTKPQYGWTCSASQNGNVKLLRTTDISKGSIEWNNVPFCAKNPDDIAKYLIEEDDILISRAGSIGISYRIKEKNLQYDTVFASYLIRFKPLIIIASYIEYFFKSHLYWDFIMGSKAGIAIPNVNASKLKDLPVPLPPLNEQQRIATKLDTIMPKIEAVNARLERIPQIIKRFRQSVLTAAVTGKLTEQWREEHLGILGPKADNTSTLYDIYLPSSWEACTLGVLSAYVTSGSRGWAKYYSEKGSIFIRAQNIKTDELTLDDVAFVQLPEKAEGRRTKIEKGDILITITGANVTKTALVRKSLEDAYVNQHVALVRLNEAIFGPYLHLWLIAPNAGRRQLEDAAYGAGKPGLNLQNIKDVVVHLPPIEEQREIVRQVDKFFAFADKLEAHYQKAKAKVEKLPQSVLAKAFRGELVPQNPDDEPAEKLLERIKAEKVRLEKKRKNV